MDLNQVPKNDNLWTALRMYQASEQTMKLKSEKNRTLFAENFESKQAPALSTCCLKVIAQNYKGRPINLNLSSMQMKTFYDFVDIELPIPNCINILDNYFWKRVFSTKCTDKMLLKRINQDRNVDWKNLAVTLKYIEVLEGMPVEIWIPDEMSKLARMVSPYVTDLKISKLQPLRQSSFIKALPSVSEPSVESGEDEPMADEEQELQVEETDDVQYDYPVEDCHHIDLSVFKNLRNLYSLTVEFLPPELSINYHTRYFNFSYVDMQNLASGLSELPNLKVLKIRRSRMDCVKLSIILEVLKYINLQHIEFYYCQLDDECGESLYEFLISTETLKHFDLSGNYFATVAIDYLAEGIQNSPSELNFLGLSNNPILDESLCNLTTTLLQCKQITHVTLSGVKITNPGSQCLIKLVKYHKSLEELEIIAVPIDGKKLIEALEGNHLIQQLLCQGSGLTLDEEFNIELLLRRNRYIRNNPYIGDTTKTEAEINAFVGRIKNSILLKAMAAAEKRSECIQKQAERRLSIASEDQSILTSPSASQLSTASNAFVYNAARFSEKELDDRVTLFGQSDGNFFKKNAKKTNQ